MNTTTTTQERQPVRLRGIAHACITGIARLTVEARRLEGLLRQTHTAGPLGLLVDERPYWLPVFEQAPSYLETLCANYVDPPRDGEI